MKTPFPFRTLQTIADHWNALTFAAQAATLFVALAVVCMFMIMLTEWFLGPVMERHIGGVRVVSARKLARRTRAKNSALRFHQFYIGSVPWPIELQDKHGLVSGTTGVGKSTFIKSFILQMRAFGRRAIIVDLNGEFAAVFKNKSDLIFNPFIPGSVRWNPLSEIRSVGDVDMVLKAALPTGLSADEEGWRQSARQFLRVLLLRLREDKELNMARLRYFVLEAGEKELAAFLQAGDQPYRIQANQMMSTVKSIVQNCVNDLSLASADSDFSICEWVRTGKGFIFIAPQDKDLAALAPLISTFINLALAQALSAPVGRRYAPIALVVDELATFDLDKFEAVLEKGRKFGLLAIAGIQTVAQLRKKFGADGASILLACFRTKLIFNPGDAETAKRMSEEIGSQVIERREMTTSRGQGRASSSVAWRRETRQAVTAESLNELPDLNAYLKLGGNYPIARIAIPFVHLKV